MSEALLQEQVCNHLRFHHPTVLFRSDSAGVNRTSWTARRYAQTTQAVKGWPDLQVVAMRGGYGGLFLELKTEQGTPYLKDGVTLRNDPHVREQALVLEQLRVRGYAADFAVGLGAAIEKLEAYLSLALRDTGPGSNQGSAQARPQPYQLTQGR